METAKLKRLATLADRARVDVNGSIYTGDISMISQRGINIDYRIEDFGLKTMFVKWWNVKEIIKKGDL